MLSDTNINTGRQYALDNAKGLAIIYMIVCHTVLYFSPGYKDTVSYVIADSIIGGPSTAPYFMICLGLGLVYSHRTTPLYLFKRGLMLLFGSYLLNLARGGFFLLLSGWLFGWHDNEFGVDFAEESFFAIMIVDILQFAGLMFLFFALALKLKLKNWMLVVVALALQVFSHYFEGYKADNEYVTALLALFLPTGDISYDDLISCFPFCVWVIYPVVGYLFGQLLLRVNDLDRFYRWMFWPTLALSCFYFVIMYTTEKMLPYSTLYYWHGLIEVFFYLCIDFCILAAFHLFSANLPQILIKPLAPLSYDITRVYCVSWCIIVWLRMACQMTIMDEEGIEPMYAYFLSVPIIFASYYIQKWAKRKKGPTPAYAS